MQQFTYTIKDPDGVHARPAGALIRTIAPFKSAISLEANGRTINLKGGIFALMGLGIKCGTEIKLTIEGIDEDDATNTLKIALAEYM